MLHRRLAPPGGQAKGRSSFLKKRSKRLLPTGCGRIVGQHQEVKGFWFFFSKKNMLPLAGKSCR
jgi:hypothetical protein